MIKKLFFTAALMVPSLAYGGNPSANLSVQVVPAGKPGNCGTIAGQAGSDVATAGFTTCALYNDWTTAIPNSVGTGLPSNWLDCAQGGDTTAIWHYGIVDRGASGTFPSCATHILQTTDPATGTLALAERSIQSDLVEGVLASGYNTIQTVNFDGAAPASGFFPFGYQEVTFRFSDTPTFLESAFWSTVADGGFFSNWVERDSWECGSFIGQLCNTEGTLWVDGSTYGGFFENANDGFSGFDPTQYHTWGTMWSGDGNGNYSVCTYVDGGDRICQLRSDPPNAMNTAAQVRQFLRLEYAIYNGPCGMDGVYTCLSPYGTQTMYIKDVKFLSCSNFASPTALCNGTASNGNFYQ